jgi:gentisate 1,2-dioxygenase
MTTRRFAADDEKLDDLYGDLATADLQPLWLLQGLLPVVPDGLSPHLWRWKELRELASRAGDLVTIERGGDRRVLSLAHPDLGGLPFATHTLWGAVQFLGPHERAPAHRHSPAALRFVLEGSGVWTLVNGDPVRMEPGDLVLTPSYSWHEHNNSGAEPMIWFDGLDLPLVRNLDAVFFEPGPDVPAAYVPAGESGSERHYGSAGLAPVGATLPATGPPGSGAHSPLLAYRWAETDARLTAMLEVPGQESATVRYVDPVTGRDIMPTLRAEMHRLRPGHRTPAIRTVGSAIWVVYRGSGHSTVGDQRFAWGPGDMFVAPSWAPVDHQATEPADLFTLSDAPLIAAAGLYRTEVVGVRG